MTLQAQDFQNHAWKHRVIIVKGNDAERSAFLVQFHPTKQEELKERKIVIYSVGRTTTLINHADGQNPIMYPDVELPQKYQDMLQKDETFEILLIGLDGSVKMRKTSSFTPQELYDKIDSMPMRRSELRKN
ncbi:uncharacterized protein DUF4174 [Kordia periserrulae]|uniref:Uncharacterized protein DUF4174 n=1 Tax=Kordia periserrulae TaxID=701523 RepID=A0A2T6C418_9FLAO|nr:DUF4174 domain-containing protein [Kordia periserrulae]PTX63071.1 uncharacterized protein DUF4174 [Kordia periserrulae]